jgi:hypothetical protein
VEGSGRPDLRVKMSKRNRFKEVRSKTCRSEWPRTGTVGSNPTRGMGVCVHLFCVCVVLCVRNGLAMG